MPRRIWPSGAPSRRWLRGEGLSTPSPTVGAGRVSRHRRIEATAANTSEHLRLGQLLQTMSKEFSRSRRKPSITAIAIKNTSSGARRAAKTFAVNGNRMINLDGFADHSADEDSDELAGAYKQVQSFKKLEPGTPGYTPLASFHGNPAVVDELKELIELLRDSSRYTSLGARPPKGVLLCGESGTGKTMAARILASESQVPFVAISGSDFRQSPWSGVGTSMVLKLFRQAKKKAPCLIFIDEFDTVGETRRQVSSGGVLDGMDSNSAKADQDASLNALLAQLDGFEPNSGVLVIAATNRPEVLDEALLRPGRFDRRIEFRLPDVTRREEILSGLVSSLKLEGNGPDITNLAKRTAAFSPADLQGFVDAAGITAAKAGRGVVSIADFEQGLLETLRRKAKARPEGSFQVVERVDTTLEDVRGHDEAVQELRGLIDVLVNRTKYQQLGATAPRGLLLEGPPGVGKTHCARALAGEAGLPFLAASASEFQASRYAGHGTQLVKRLFALAKRLQPCIIFLDEVDAIGRRRESSSRGAEQDRENTLMQLLIELDGFGQDSSEVLLVAATNRADVLDPALVRPGRLDRRLSFELPDTSGRHALLEFHAKSKQLQEDIDLVAIARRTSGLSGADLKGLLNEAALKAGARGASAVQRADIDYASDRIQIGIEKVRPNLSSRARRLTAIHEAGHVVLGLAFSTMTGERLIRASIRPRLGGIGGVTLFEPIQEDAEGSLPPGIYTRRGLCASLCVELGGRVAEEVLLKHPEVSSGASSDLRTATRRAMSMAAEWGLGDSLLSLEALGGRCSDATQRQAELAAAQLLSESLKTAREVLRSVEGLCCLQVIAEHLLDVEEAEGSALSDLVNLEELQSKAAFAAREWDE